MSDKEKRINKEYKKITEIYSAIPIDKKKLYDNLMQNTAFMIVTLQDLQKEINDVGMVDEYQNGENQRGKKTGAALSAYNTTVKQYLAAIKQLDTLVSTANTDEFKDF